MNDTRLPADPADLPLWRLIVLLDDLERNLGASSPRARAIARLIAERLGVVSAIGPDAEVAAGA